MRVCRYGLLAVLLASVLVAGCGGGSDGPETGGAVTLQVYERSPGLVLVNAEWAAFQDGNSPWQPIDPSETGVYTATVTDAQGRFGFALCDDGALHLQYGTLAEGDSLVQFLDNGLRSARVLPTGYGQIMGSISYDFAAGQTSAVTPTSQSTSSPISSYAAMLQVGLFDLAVVDSTWTSPRMANWIYLLRGLTMSEGSTTFNFTVTSADRILLEDGGTAQVTGSAAGAIASLSYVTANGTPVPIAYDDDVADGTLACRTVPAAASVTGDHYDLSVTRNSVMVTGAFADPAAISLPAPDESFNSFLVQLVTEGDFAYFRFSSLDEPDTLGYFVYASAGGQFVDVIVSTGWLAGNDNSMVQVPDLTSLDGWQTAWSILPGADITDMDAQAFLGNVPLAQAVGRYFSSAGFPLSDGQWTGVVPWDD